MTPPASKTFWQTLLRFSIGLSLLAFYQAFLQIQALDVLLWRSKWVILLGAFLVNLIAAAWALASLHRGRLEGLVKRLDSRPQGMGWKAAAVLLSVLGFAAVWLIRLKVFGRALPQVFPSLWVFWWASLLAAAGIRLLTGRSWAGSFAFAVLLQGVLFISYGRLRFVSDFPFSLGYSEANRYYYGSLLFSESLYGMKLPLSPFHPTRYFLLAIPFLIQGLPLWGHRLWQALLWIGLAAASSYALAQRLRHLEAGLALLVGAWFFTYLFQGAVYYHLQVMVVIILLGVSAKHPWRSLAAVLAASFWAGMSRINWFPVPAMLAIAIYLLEEPVSSYTNLWRYLATPVLWGALGLTTALLSQGLYILWSGNAQNPEVFGSSLSSSLLWERLFPNPSYPLGVLPGILIVSAPLVIALVFLLRRRGWHRLRLLGLGAMLLVLFGGGIVVSMKIGGGAELHNMDAYLVLLGSVTAYLLSGQAAAEKGVKRGGSQVAWPLLALGLLVPLAFAIRLVEPGGGYDRAAVQRDVQTLAQVASAAAQNGEVLFISERQLLTFGNIHGVPLVPDYELITLMEMAMSGNMDYLKRFYADLSRHRFAVIIARRQSTDIQRDKPFADENNAWNQFIAVPLLCAYEPVQTLRYANVQVFLPRSQTPANCP